LTLSLSLTTPFHHSVMTSQFTSLLPNLTTSTSQPNYVYQSI
jgi:hypothetical protein